MDKWISNKAFIPTRTLLGWYFCRPIWLGFLHLLGQFCQHTEKTRPFVYPWSFLWIVDSALYGRIRKMIKRRNSATFCFELHSLCSSPSGHLGVFSFSSAIDALSSGLFIHVFNTRCTAHNVAFLVLFSNLVYHKKERKMMFPSIRYLLLLSYLRLKF